MRRRHFLKLSSQLLCGSALFSSSSAARMTNAHIPKPRKPYNVLLLLADDLRADALGFMGNSIINTPHLDQLASKSTIFNNCFVTTSICPTSRASILTGLYASNHNIWDFQSGMNEALWSKSLPYLFQQKGYRTGFIGKWGLGGKLPTSKYDFFSGFSGQGEYYKDGIHLQDRLLSSFQDFIEGPLEKPFFLQVSFKTPHVQDGASEPFQAPSSLKDLYNEWVPKRLPTDAMKYFHNLPLMIQKGEGVKRYKKRYQLDTQFQHNMRQYYRLITGMDQTIGKALKIIETKNLLHDTIIIFTSDNGLLTGEYGLAGKWWMFEGSIRVPLTIYIPSKSPTRDTRMSLNIDIAPTLQKLCNLKNQENHGLELIHPNQYYEREAFYYEHRFQTNDVKILPSSGLRTNQHKYIKFKNTANTEEFLFNIAIDRHEKYNLVHLKQYQYLLSEMRNLHDKLELNLTSGFSD